MLLFLYTLVDPEDQAGIEYIYRTYHDDMIRLAKSRLKRADDPNYALDAEDAVQNAYVKITKYIKKINLQATDRELKAYLLSIVAHEVTNLLKEYTYFEDIDDYTGISEEDEARILANINERYEEVVQAIRSMDDKYSLTLLYRLRDEMTVSEIAEFMGIPEKTVYTRLARGKKMLYEILSKEGGET